MLFNELQLIEPIQEALVTKGYTKATPIQSKAIPALLKGEDMLGCAQTGTGKTAAFSIPILQNLATKQGKQNGKRKIKALVVAPTRELALQIGDSFREYGTNLEQRTTVIFGGVGQKPQTNRLEKGVDILVATPGRLLDLIGQGYIDLGYVEHFVLDEADQMLDMGMLRDVKRIIKYLPAKRQTMFFSATMPASIASFADTILKQPVKITIKPEYSPIDIIEQEVYFIDKGNKTALLIDLLKDRKYDSVLVFSRTKHGADKIVKALARQGLDSVAIHGNKSQNKRQKALKEFKERTVRILVATDVAARGLDISELSHVINYNLSEVPETYVHRIGRTGRAGLGGKAISFCDFEEKDLLRSIEKLISKKLPEVKGHAYPLRDTTIKPKAKQGQRPQRRNQGNAASNGSSKPSRTNNRKTKSTQSNDRRSKSTQTDGRKSKSTQGNGNKAARGSFKQKRSSGGGGNEIRTSGR
ncbi:DEAD/DEAH box helicase [Gottschalkiaceae bacterium SANA]|nr:DEAD/DEAH box helicase [Gottschalkiaceae bacterium SANA]